MERTTVRRRRRGWIRVGLVVVIAALATPFGNTPASATTATAYECVETNTFTFDPPLTLGSQIGFVDVVWTNTCVRVVATDAVVGSGATVVTNSGSARWVYGGSCALVQFFTGAVANVMVGPLYIEVIAGSEQHVKVMPVTPTQGSCAAGGMAKATGTGPKTVVSVS